MPHWLPFEQTQRWIWYFTFISIVMLWHLYFCGVICRSNLREQHSTLWENFLYWEWQFQKSLGSSQQEFNFGIFTHIYWNHWLISRSQRHLWWIIRLIKGVTINVHINFLIQISLSLACSQQLICHVKRVAHESLFFCRREMMMLHEAWLLNCKTNHVS